MSTEKITMKRRIFDFIKSKGKVRYKDIVVFVHDTQVAEYLEAHPDVKFDAERHVYNWRRDRGTYSGFFKVYTNYHLVRGGDWLYRDTDGWYSIKTDPKIAPKKKPAKKESAPVVKMVVVHSEPFSVTEVKPAEVAFIAPAGEGHSQLHNMQALQMLQPFYDLLARFAQGRQLTSSKNQLDYYQQLDIQVHYLLGQFRDMDRQIFGN